MVSFQKYFAFCLLRKEEGYTLLLFGGGVGIICSDELCVTYQITCVLLTLTCI